MKQFLSVLLSVMALAPVAQAKLDIVGGSGVVSGSAVAQSTVAIYFENHVLCTATIIGADVLLTAAHCVVDEQGLMGVVIFGSSLEDKGATMLPIVGIVMPKNYVAETSATNRNDIAVVRFVGALPVGYSPANLPGADLTVTDSASLTVAGYGLTDATNQDTAGHLLQTTTQVLSAEISQTEFVTGTKGSGVCSGDSGGPAYMMSGGQTYVVGVTNLSDKGCTGFSVFLKVTPYLGWIKSAIETLHQSS